MPSLMDVLFWNQFVYNVNRHWQRSVILSTFQALGIIPLGMILGGIGALLVLFP